jgi:hypothetical protein
MKDYDSYGMKTSKNTLEGIQDPQKKIRTA